MRRVLLLALALLATSAASARAGTLVVGITPAGHGRPERVGGEFTAAPGETNHLTVAGTIHDDGAPIALTGFASGECTRLDASTIRCPRLTDFSADLGDGDDTLTTAFPGLEQGGDGNDVLIGSARNHDRLLGGPGNDTLFGGDGRDILNGGEGADRLAGGAGDDQLTPGPGADAVDGGPGTDTLVTSDSTFPGFFDLETGQSEADPRLRDALTSVEGVSGGPGPDVIRGTEGPDVIAATFDFLSGTGGDQLFGRGGNDELIGNPGAPVNLYGGAGNDLLRSYDRRDSLTCGGGRDTVANSFGTQSGVFIPADCERVTNVSGFDFTHGRVARGRLLIAVQIHRPYPHGVCRARLTAGRPQGASYARLVFTRAGKLSLPLGRAGRAAARRHTRLELRIGGRCRGLFGASWRIRP